MAQHVGRRIFSLLVVFGAVIFGMVLAGGLDLTVPGVGSNQEISAPPPPAAGSMALPDFAALAERVSPAVVSIEVHAFQSRSSMRRVDPFEFFFGPRRRPQPEEDDERERDEFRRDSGGSGFIVSADGLVVTNNHVIDGADEILVRMGEDIFEATVKGTDPATDLALLEIEAEEELAYLKLGDSEVLNVGEWVMAIGSPQGLIGTVTVGVVSAKGRRIGISSETTSFENFIQTDAAINFGNSGGPLINLRGEVVGINTAINYGAENIGFAVPVNVLRQVLPQLREDGKVRRGYLGIGVEDLDRNAAEAFGLDSTDGAMVTQVQPGRPADEAGVEIGDVILEVDGNKVTTTRELIDYVSARGPDVTVTLTLWRDGETVELDVKLAERPLESISPIQEDEPSEAGIEWLGVRYQDLTPGLKSMHGLPDDLDGVWITSVSPRSPLYDEGVTDRTINVITEVNGREVDSVAAFEEIVGGARSGSRLRIYLRRFANGQEIQPLFVFPAVP